ncbi:hypothetical protein MGALJ_16990 [Mycobacterium gallinarum]|uniref:Uncharacterized protein n=1 Tax=Mycobacterium gallinarum TaxID=39689 RepID=A0A9W4B6W4_9MYCO|nr:hypothetical protein MGALJ_16990 [Mycobacterium gallinarum]
MATRVPQPRDTDSITDRELAAVCFRTDFDHFGDYLVARDHPAAMHRQVALGDVKIGAAHATCPHGDEELARRGPWHVGGDFLQRSTAHRARPVNSPCLHRRGAHHLMVTLCLFLHQTD